MKAMPFLVRSQLRLGKCDENLNPSKRDLEWEGRRTRKRQHFIVKRLLSRTSGNRPSTGLVSCGPHVTLGRCRDLLGLRLQNVDFGEGACEHLVLGSG